MPAAARLFISAVLVLGLVSLPGCGGGSGQRAPLKNSEFVGKWVEQVPPRPPTFKDKDLRRELELTEDGTFKLTVTDLSGKPVTPARGAEGTWTTKGLSLVFTVNSDQMGAGELDSPQQTLRIQLKARGFEKDMLEIREVKGGRTSYIRS